MDSTARNDYSAAQVQPEPKTTPVSAPKTDPLPLNRKVPFSLFERIAVVVGSVVVACLMAALVSSKIALGANQNKVQSIDEHISTVSAHNTDLKQEISSLNSSDRLQAFAKKVGLTFNEQSVRNISK